MIVCCLWMKQFCVETAFLHPPHLGWINPLSHVQQPRHTPSILTIKRAHILFSSPHYFPPVTENYS